MDNITLEELKESLALNFNPEELIELLNLDSEDIVDRFGDIIEMDFGYYAEILDNYVYDGNGSGENEETAAEESERTA